MTQRPEKNQKIFTWGYAHIRAGGGGQGVVGWICGFGLNPPD